MSTDYRNEPIAIVGASAIFPGSIDATGFWTDILGAEDLVREIPDSHWLIDDYYDADPSAPDKTYAKRGAFLDLVDFDPLEWGVPPSIVPATDTTQLLALIVAKQVLRDALGSQFKDADLGRTACILGVTSAQELLGTMVNRLQKPVWVKALREMGYAEDEVQQAAQRIADHYVPWQESTFPGLLGNVVAGRIANRLDLGGTNCVTDAACASSFSALSMAVNELRLGQSDMVITGGADTMNDIFMYMCFSKTPALSKSGDCRPFSDRADGTLLGEGLGMVALKRMSDAVAAGDRIYAVIKGVGSSSDGRSKSVYAPVPQGQAKALRRAYEGAGYSARTVELVEAHGTGTKAGDAAEFEGLKQAFGEVAGEGETQWCALGTVKSQVGHTKAAAGAAGLFKVVMALHHKVLPPTIKIDQPNPKLQIEESPFYLNTETRPWIRGTDHPRRASVSSFGFGGSNFHITLEEYLGDTPQPRLRTLPSELVCLSADSPTSLADRARGLADQVAGHKDLRYAAHWAATAFENNRAARLAVVAESAADLVSKLRTLADHMSKNPDADLAAPNGIYYAHGSKPGGVAFVFPGQGSQYLNMGADLAMTWDVARAAWDEAADLDLDGEKLQHTVFPTPVFTESAGKRQSAKLTRTEWAQPAIGCASLAQLALLERLGVKADAVAGHSFGEITALAAAGVITRDQVVPIARKRGLLMAEAAASHDGAMTAVPRGIDEVRAIADKIDGVVVANHNGPAQVVLSGTTAAIADAEAQLAKAGIEAKRLPVATAFHSPVVSDSAAPFTAYLTDVNFKRGKVPVWSNTDAKPYPKTSTSMAKMLGGQLAKPVRWVEQVEGLYDQGVRTFIEVGPGRVLTNLIGDILNDRPHVAVNLDRKRKHGVTSLFHGLARLAVAGLPLDLISLWDGYAIPADPASLPKPKMALRINGSNYDKPYPPQGGNKSLPKPNTVRTGEAASRDRVEVREVPVEVRVEVPVEVPVQVPVHVTAPHSAPGVPVMSDPTHNPLSQHPGAHVASTPVATQSVAPQPGADQAWLAAFQEAQRATADAHAAWQASMSSSHLAFLQTVERSFQGMSTLMGAQPQPSTVPALSAPAPALAPPAHSTPVMPQVPPPAVPAANGFEPAATLAVSDGSDLPPAAEMWNPTPAVASEAELLVQSGVDVVPGAKPVEAPVLSAPPAPATPALDLNALMLEVVAEKTGYPVEMLGMEMELESDLGVDSIKRVEILSAMRERAPELPEVDAGEMATLVTLGQIVDYMSDALPAAPAAVAQPPATSSAPGLDLNALMLEVVAEKTGYPVEMLGMEMELESDLGVDSIKRVEILSAMRERAPELPEVDAAEMATLVTLGQIVDYMGATLPAAGPVVAAAPTPAPSGLNLEALMLEVVAEKTGYPVDMLGLQMELESDLGVDSIKRVEILSAMRERAPELPEVDAAEMATLVTLGQIVDYMGATLGPVAAAPATVSAPSIDLERLMLEVVADKTGYPVDMLGLQMELESDLGVDSIKRVEILSAMRERAPELPEVDAAEMATLVTLGQIVEYMGKTLGPATPAPSSPTTAATVAAPATPSIDLEKLMLEVVAEKTGYPAEMLGLQMELESDLGVDSIKRVEILSAMRERAPELPEVDAAEMATLVTLGQIVTYMRDRGAGAPDAAPAVTEAAAALPELARYVLEAVPREPAGLALPGLSGKVVITGHKALGKTLVTALKRRGIASTVTDSVPADADAVIVLSGMVDGGDDLLCAANRVAFDAASTVAPRFASGTGLFVTVQDTGGDFGLAGTDRPWVGGLAGLVKTAGQEWPNATVQALDIARGGRKNSEVAAVIADALTAGGPELEVGYKADGTRLVLSSRAAETSGDAPALAKGDVVVASGGARGVTATTLIALAADTGARFALMGRTPLTDEPTCCAGVDGDAALKGALLKDAKANGTKVTPAELGKQVKRILANREIRGTIEAITKAGGEARYITADVTDVESIDRALTEVRSDWGPISGLVHGAGVLADKLIAEKTAEQFDFVFDTKVKGARALLQATKGDPLKAIVMFSSVAGRCGNRGQCDYAMANEVLNKIAGREAARRDNCTVRSMGWGPWDGGMVTPGLKAHFTRLGVPLITLDAGARMLVDELRDGGNHVELVLGGEPKMGPLAAEHAKPTVRLAVRPSKGTHPYLKDHTIQGTPVVPVVFAVEWFARAARALRPDLSLATVNEVKVLRGIKLSDFEAGEWLTVTATELRNGHGALVGLELRGDDDALYYTATAEMTESPVTADRAPATIETEPFSGDVYDGDTLFHGDDFQVITELQGIGDAGISATLDGTLSKGWGTENWATDPAAMDGGLQLALLWTRRALGTASLPMAVGAMHAYTDRPGSGPLTATLTGSVKGRDRAVSDIVFTDTQGDVVAELRGVETIAIRS